MINSPYINLLPLLQPVLADYLLDPKGPLSTPAWLQAIAEATEQVQVMVIAEASKKAGDRCFDTKTSTGTVRSTPMVTSIATTA